VFKRLRHFGTAAESSEPGSDQKRKRSMESRGKKQPMVDRQESSQSGGVLEIMALENSPDLLDDRSGRNEDKDRRSFMSRFRCMSSMRIVVLVVLCLQNSLFTVLRRYSQGVLKENYSKYEVLLVGEVIKMAFSAYMIKGTLDENVTLTKRLQFLVQSSRKMIVLALIYGAMNILSFVSLRNIGAGMFTIFAQCKILTTASFSALMLNRKYSWTQWRAMIALMLGVLLFSEPIWGKSGNLLSTNAGANVIVGTVAVLIEVILSGFASIYFEKVIKIDPQQLSIWERNFQLALGSFPVYLCFIATDSPAEGFGSGWSIMAVVVTSLGAGGGLLVALSIKYGDSILKTLATTGAIILSSVLDNLFLGGPLTPTMMIAGLQVIVAICNYTFDSTSTEMKLVKPIATRAQGTETSGKEFDEEQALIREEK
jgi:UDP-sugar transporter A1/2/3